MSKSTKIGILGRMGAGKTFLANEFIRQCHSFVRLAFADKVKSIASEVFKMKFKDRELLQSIGGKMREIDENVWVNYLLEKAQDYTHIVIDDVRYENEIIALKQNGFTIIYLDLDRETQISRLKITYPDNWRDHVNLGTHESECANQYQKYADIVLSHQQRQETTDFVTSYLTKHIIKINNVQALDLELQLNNSPHGHEWVKLGDKLYEWRLNRDEIKKDYYITTPQANWIRQNLNQKLANQNSPKYSLTLTEYLA